MTDQQENHLKRIKLQFLLDVDRKYRAGAEEHANDAGGAGGILLNLSLERIVDEGIAEAIDMAVYLYSVKERMQTLKATVAGLNL
jgi:hypothetical protein